MKPHFPLKSRLLLVALPLVAGFGAVFQAPLERAFFPDVSAQNSAKPAQNRVSRPRYDLDLKLDTQLLTLESSAKITVPATSADPISDAVFFLYANADGVGGANSKQKNLVVQSVSLNGKSVPFTLEGAVLRAKLPSPQSAPFALEIQYRGVVPRAPAQKEGIAGMLGAELDLGALLGGAASASPAKSAPAKPKNTDYGLYTFGNDILSLGAFWYPQLAVRRDKKWADNAPQGLGDVAFSEKSDFRVNLQIPPSFSVVAPGKIARSGNAVQISAPNIREFALVISDEFVSKKRAVQVGGKSVSVESFAHKNNAKKLDESLEITAKSLQIFAKRFGPYLYDEFRVVESPLRSGAGGMEYSGVIAIASMLYGDMSAGLGELTTTLNLPGVEGLLGDLGAGETAKNEAPQNGSPPNDLLGGILGQQSEILGTMFETTIAHEVAHQWWAIGVGSDSQNHPFVDEALTNYSAILYFEDRYGPEKAAQMSDLHLKTTFSMGAMLGGDKPANLPTASYSGNLQYGAVIYGKAALFYGELRELLGDEAFFAGLRTYYARYSGKIADENSLKAIFLAGSSAKRAQIEALYKRWIYEAHGAQDIGVGMGEMFGGLDISGILGGLLGGIGGAGE